MTHINIALALSLDNGSATASVLTAGGKILSHGVSDFSRNVRKGQITSLSLHAEDVALNRYFKREQQSKVA